MEKNDFEILLNKQREFFQSGKTLDISFRKKALRNLEAVIRKYENDILNAVKEDLRKSDFEGYTNEIGIVYIEIKHILKNLSKWAKPEKRNLEFYLQPGSGRIYSEPYGNTLIISPWNYPFQLLIAPLIAAVSAGNTAVTKPSELSPAASNILEVIIKEAFQEEFVAVVKGGADETTALLKLKFDKIFFTGSVPVGKIVMEAASKNLTPVTLELGGKSPVIVDKTANLKLAARKIVWGKFNNAGQTCVAPDYILADEDIEEEFVELLKETIVEFYGENPELSSHYGRVINERHTERLSKLIDNSKVVYGGIVKKESKYISPTIMRNVSLNDPVMSDEIFGPILPVMTYKTIDQAINIIRGFTKPLALYLFTSDKKMERMIIRNVTFGGGSINTTILHVASSKLPFGGVGHSGTGSYHGKAGFDDFSHKKSILKQPSLIDFGLTYPGKSIPLKLLKKFM